MLSTRSPEKKRFFLTRRLIRILPLYWGLTVFTFAAGLIFPSVIGYRPTADQLVKSLLFIPYERATAKAGTALRPLVGLGHTLQMEMLFYLLFLIAMRISHKRRGVIAALFAAVVPLIGVLFPTRFPPVHFYTANPYVWTSFLIGLAVYGVFDLLQKKEPAMKSGRIPVILAFAAVAALAVPALLRETSPWYAIGLFTAVFCAGLVFSACGGKTPRFVRKCGDISYSYYLLHYYIVTLGARFFKIDCFSPLNLLLAALMCAAAWGISYCSWYVIEQKIPVFLTKRIIGRAGSVPKDGS